MAPAVARRKSQRLERRNSSHPYESGGKHEGSGLTSYMDGASLDWNEDTKAEVAPQQKVRVSSFRRGKAKVKEEKLPPNWKKAKDKDGNVYYVNTVTQRRSHEVPPPLPGGWKEALHKESGRAYYYHKKTRQTTFEFPSGDPMQADDDDDEDDEPPEAPEGFFSRTISKFAGKPKGDGSAGMRQSSFGRKPRAASKAKPGQTEAKEGGASGQRTVFISCSALIKEVKLCVGDELQEALDTLLAQLTAQEVPAEQAVKKLMALVGSTSVQQAGLSVMNAQKGILPHGWLEYIDEASNRPYYYNVHTKVTTWYKPAMSPTAVLPREEDPGGSEGMVTMDCSVDMHSVAMSGFL